MTDSNHEGRWRLWAAHTVEKPDEYPLPHAGDRRLLDERNICLGILFGGYPTLPQLETAHEMIVAAPEVTEALRDTLNMLQAAHMQCGVDHRGNKRVIKARAALAKATGNSIIKG